jgi:hypothetical protein
MGRRKYTQELENLALSAKAEAALSGNQIDPIIEGLLVRLPYPGAVWPATDRQIWLDLLSGAFGLIYRETEVPASGTD